MVATMPDTARRKKEKATAAEPKLTAAAQVTEHPAPIHDHDDAEREWKEEVKSLSARVGQMVADWEQAWNEIRTLGDVKFSDRARQLPSELLSELRLRYQIATKTLQTAKNSSYTGEVPSPETAAPPQFPMGDKDTIQAAAELLSSIYPRKAVESALADLAANAAREATARVRAAPRLKWTRDRLPDENPAAFAWRAYQAEAEAGTLHRGVIGQEDPLLRRDLNNWLRTHAMPEGIDIPTLPEWNTRGLAKLADDPSVHEVLRLGTVARRRRERAATPH
jgi:hypothetical protein